MSNLAPCTHEEADNRLIIHALDESLRGHRRIKIRTNDTDAGTAEPGELGGFSPPPFEEDDIFFVVVLVYVYFTLYPG